MEAYIKEVLITEEQIRDRVAELGLELSRDYASKNPVIVGVLKGVVVFYADMIRQIKVPCQMDFMWISSYSGTQSSGMIVRKDVTVDLKGRHVVILEDIFDTGNSLQFAYNHLMEKEPASLEICTLLDKLQKVSALQQHLLLLRLLRGCRDRTNLLQHHSNLNCILLLKVREVAC